MGCKGEFDLFTFISMFTAVQTLLILHFKTTVRVWVVVPILITVDSYIIIRKSFQRTIVNAI